MSEDLRQQKFIIVAGTNGTGKTTSMIKLVDFYSRTSKRCLLGDSDGMEEKFFKFPEITAKELKTFSGAKRIFIEDASFLNLFADTFLNRERPIRFNGLLALDDARTFLTSRDEMLLKILRRRRQTNLDIIILFHGLTEVPPSMWTFATDLVMHYTNDSYKRLAKNLPEHHLEKFELSMNRVRNEYVKGNLYYNELIKLR